MLTLVLLIQFVEHENIDIFIEKSSTIGAQKSTTIIEPLNQWIHHSLLNVYLECSNPQHDKLKFQQKQRKKIENQLQMKQKRAKQQHEATHKKTRFQNNDCTY